MKVRVLSKWFGYCIMGGLLFVSCHSNTPIASNSSAALIEKARQVRAVGEAANARRTRRQDSLSKRIQQREFLTKLKDTSLINIEMISSDFSLDMKYTTSDNFLKAAVYPCEKCFVRGVVAKALLKVNTELTALGYRLQFYDCYRPLKIQKKMWEIVSDPGYVADPKVGSIHNRGAAVDVTLVRNDGTPIDMGTPFDHFGKEAHHNYRKLPKEVLKHRKLLRSVMEKHGFGTIKTEWWHYNFQRTSRRFKVRDWEWECEG